MNESKSNTVDDSVVLLLDENVSLSCQRSLLCQSSPYFNAMFSQRYVESEKQEIRLHGISKEAMEKLILYAESKSSLDCNDIGINNDNVISILQAAGMLQFEEIRKFCSEFILDDGLGLHNALQIFVVSDFLGEKEIRDIALHMVLWSFDETTSGEFLCDVPYNCLLLLLNHNHLNTKSEIHLFNILERWVESDMNNRSQHYLPLLKCLRAQSLSETELVIILDSQSVKKNKEVFNYVEDLLKERRSNDPQNSKDAFKKSTTNDCDQNISSHESNVLTPERKPPVVPCVIGRINPNPKQKFRQKDSIPRLLIYRKEEEMNKYFIDFQTARVHKSFNDESSDNLSLRLKESLNSQGYQMTSNGPIFYITGGELVLGKNNWNRFVWQHNTITSKWDVVGELKIDRRHHSVCLSENGMGLYLIGGFGRKRLILDKVEFVSFTTMEVIELPPMPTQIFSPASCFFNGALYVIKSQIYVYEPDLKTWSTLMDVEIPKNIEFNKAIVYEDSIFLTGNHSYDLYRFMPTPKSQPHFKDKVYQHELKLEFVGKFKNETQNVCLVGDDIFNFSTDPFEYNSCIETCNLKTKEFKVVWDRETEEFDFSPYQSLGCFPLVVY